MPESKSTLGSKPSTRRLRVSSALARRKSADRAGRYSIGTGARVISFTFSATSRTGVETFVREVAEKVKEITRAPVPIEYLPARSADFRRARAELTLSRRVLGFEPSVDFDSGMRRYIAWLRDREAAAA